MSPAAIPPEEPAYEFYLYVTGATPNSTRALRNIKEICELYLPGQYILKIIDIYREPQMAQQEQIVASPTLIRHRPLPQRRLVGDLSNRATVLAVLGIDHQLPPTSIS
ncbi:circadian clock KaiB family protein [Hymenobacter sp. BRD67]|uniref:circadian clock KaiB family protein n=1 Tax=Hymenobacter sp. BRD67 TaxID=2675877 RepID=UPI001563048A|nr:circadian clock KaiB family protein [Hymenobacter sp. BRD67]QKG51845.1 circadian clock protein KaiB [Hymenobacter sp. BRD67]